MAARLQRFHGYERSFAVGSLIGSSSQSAGLGLITWLMHAKIGTALHVLLMKEHRVVIL